MLCILVRTVVVLLLLVLIRSCTPFVSVSVLIPFFSVPFLVFTSCFVCIIIGSIIPIDDPRTVMIITNSKFIVACTATNYCDCSWPRKKKSCYYPSYPIVSIGRCIVVYRICLSLLTYSYSDLLLLLLLLLFSIVESFLTWIQTHLSRKPNAVWTGIRHPISSSDAVYQLQLYHVPWSDRCRTTYY